MVSIKDVARAAGVSTATVSRVLASAPHVRLGARERVLDAVARLGYRPNLVARSLRAQRSNTIGLIVADIRNPFFAEVSRAVEDYGYAHRMGTLLCNTDENPEKEAIYLQLMRDTQVAGVILAPTPHAAEALSSWHSDPQERRLLPLVVIDRPLAPEFTARMEVDTVLLDNADAAYQLTAHLLTNGYRRIGALVGSDSQTGRERARGYAEALHAHQLAGASNTTPDSDEQAEKYVRQVEPRMEAGYAAALELLNVTPHLDALLAGNSLLAAGAWRAIHERGLAIPGDIALVSFDESAWEDLVEPPITLSVQPTYAIGATAADLLLRRIADPRRPAQQVTLQAQLRLGGSSAPRGEDDAADQMRRAASAG